MSAILFCGAMVRALLREQNPKQQSRRLSKRWLRVKKGDRLWVRERARVIARDIPPGDDDGTVRVRYVADGATSGPLPYPARLTWNPVIGLCLPMGCYREASRIDLEATEDAREERLQDITEEDAIAEGVEPAACAPGCDCAEWSGEAYRRGFAALWDELNGSNKPWIANPTIVRLAFRRVRP